MKDVIGLKVDEVSKTIKIEDLVKWIQCRDAACADYLVTALGEFLETGEDVK